MKYKIELKFYDDKPYIGYNPVWIKSLSDRAEFPVAKGSKNHNKNGVEGLVIGVSVNGEIYEQHVQISQGITPLYHEGVLQEVILTRKKLSEKYPPLYQCEICNKAVKVKGMGVGVEPLIKRSCDCPADTPILAKRKVTLRGKGKMSVAKKMQIKITLTIRQLLSALTGRSI